LSTVPIHERAHIDYTGWPFLYLHHCTPETTYTIQDGWETFVSIKDFANQQLGDSGNCASQAFSPGAQHSDPHL
jgi:hypothetical protein